MSNYGGVKGTERTGPGATTRSGRESGSARHVSRPDKEVFLDETGVPVPKAYAGQDVRPPMRY